MTRKLAEQRPILRYHISFISGLIPKQVRESETLQAACITRLQLLAHAVFTQDLRV